MTTELSNVILQDFQLPQVGTAAKSVTGAWYETFYPQNKEDFKISPNNPIKFIIASSNAFIDFRKSYFTFRIRLPAYAAVDSLASVGKPRFDVGGVHGIFEEITIRAKGPSVVLEDMPDYADYNCLMSMLYDDRQFIKRHGGAYGDGLNPWDYPQANQVKYSNLTNQPIAGAVSSLVAGGITFAAIAANQSEHIPINENLVVLSQNAVPINSTLLVSTANDDLAAGLYTPTATLILASGAANDTRNTYVSTAGLLSHSGIQTPSNRWNFNVQDSFASGMPEYVFKPRSAIFQHVMPLFMMNNGIEIEMKPQDMTRWFIFNGMGAAISALVAQGCTIEQPRFYGYMIKPHEDIVNEYLNRYRAEGLQYHMLNYILDKRHGGTLGTTNETVSVLAGRRSLRLALTVFFPGAIHTNLNNNNARIANSLSCYVNTRLYEFCYRVGSNSYPYRRMEWENIAVPNLPTVVNKYHLLEYLRLVTQTKHFRFDWADWNGNITFNTIYSDDIDNATTAAWRLPGRFFCIGARLDRVPFNPMSSLNDVGLMTGTDGSVLPVDLIVKRSSQYQATSSTHAIQMIGNAAAAVAAPVADQSLYMRTFVFYDSLLQISQQGIIILS